MLIPELLVKFLQDLLEDDFKSFKWFLTLRVMESCEPMARGCLEGATREDAVDKMIQKYGEASAVALAAEILRKINMNDPAQRLMSAYNGEY